MTPARDPRARRAGRVPPVRRHGDRVEREVTGREVGVEAVVERREVDGLIDAVGDDPPGAVALGEREDRPAEATCEAMRGITRIRARDVEVENGRRRSSSRTAPPTTQASSSPRISRRRSSIGRDPPGATRARVQAGRDLVPDRARDARVLLDEDPVAEERDRSAAGPRRRAGPRARPSRSFRRPGVGASTTDLGARHVAPEAVRVSDRDDADPGRSVGDVAAAVAGALARLEPLHERDVRLPAQRRARALRPRDRRRRARCRRARCHSARRRSAPPRSGASRRCSPDGA